MYDFWKNKMQGALGREDTERIIYLSLKKIVKNISMQYQN